MSVTVILELHFKPESVAAARDGDLAYITFEVADSRLARDFYGAVLGWEYEPMGQGEDWEGGMFRKDGKTVAGLGRLTVVIMAHRLSLTLATV